MFSIFWSKVTSGPTRESEQPTTIAKGFWPWAVFARLELSYGVIE